MTIPQQIHEAGRFKIEQAPCRDYVGPVLLSAPRAAVLHTTEGPFEEGALAEFKQKWAPNYLIGKDKTGKVRLFQLLPNGRAGASLEHHNNLAIAQIEMAGFSEKTLWVPDPETLDALTSLMLVIRDVLGVPLTHPYPDGSFGLYGKENHHRDKFGKMPGWFGHADVPDNDHWDPGDLAWSKVFSRAAALEAPAAPKIVSPTAPVVVS